MPVLDIVTRYSGLTIGLILLIVVLLAVGVIYMFKKSPSAASTAFNGPYPLNKKGTAVAASDFTTMAEADMFLKSGAATFQTFVYLDSIQRTGEYVPCGSSPNQPACDTGLYASCPCSGPKNCENCRHEGYKQLFSLYGVYQFEVLNVPDASRPNAALCQLAVKTHSQDVNVETIALPPLDLQKWTMVTLAHEGRRVDVYYNNRMVNSTKLEHIPSTSNYNLTYVEAGDSGLTGSLALLKFFPYRLSTPNVASLYANSVDTRGAPVGVETAAVEYTTTIQKAGEGSLVSRLCLDGSCLSFGGLKAPAVSLPQLSDSMAMLKDTGGTYDTKSISALYQVESPYA